MNIPAKIERFILDELLVGGTRKSLDPDEPLIASGVIDSLAMLRLITFIEAEFGVAISDGEVTTENFDTVRKIGSFVERKAAPSATKATGH